jgi:flagellar basal-body rod modification protein FlgD
MVAQMAQFSQVAGISEMNASLKALTESLGSGRLSDAASWIGKNVLVEAANAAPLADGSYAGEIALPQNADEVNVSLIDASGQVVHTQSFGAQKPGTIPFAWDGKGADGQPVPGPLKIAVVAKGGGSSIETAVAAWTRVTGIQSPAAGGTTQFMTGLGTVPADAAIRLS